MPPVVPSVSVREAVVLRARRQAEVHEVGDGCLALPAGEGTHGELRSCQSSSVWGVRRTHRLGNGILIRLGEALRALVLLLLLLAVAWRGRGSGRRPRSEAAAPASPLAVTVPSRDRARCLRGRELARRCSDLGGGGDGGRVRRHFNHPATRAAARAMTLRPRKDPQAGRYERRAIKTTRQEGVHEEAEGGRGGARMLALRRMNCG